MFSNPGANLLAPIALLAFPLLVCLLFSVLPPRRAVVWSCLVATLFLPEAGFNFAGLPAYSKYSVISVVWLGAVIFDGGKPFRVRARWVDLPMVLWCFGRIGSSLSNGLGFYDGVSTSVEQIVLFGVPYWLGRTYFSDRAGVLELVRGIVWGGLLYLPLCLYEVRFSPHLNAAVYGFSTVKFWTIERYGGYQPLVFMGTPLQVAMWMAASTVTCWWVAHTGAIRRLAGIPARWLAWALFVTTLLCKTRGAIVLTLIGVSLFYATRAWRTALPFALLLGIAASYPVLRGTGLLDAERILGVAAVVFDARPVESLSVRLRSEDKYIEHVKERPLLGWGGYGRGEVYSDGKRSIPDGLWVIALSRAGWLAVLALAGSYLIPPLLMLRRLPAGAWVRAEHAPGTALAVLLLIYWIDCLLNAMLTPVLIIAIGSASGLFVSPVFSAATPAPPRNAPESVPVHPPRASSLARALIERRRKRDGRPPSP